MLNPVDEVRNGLSVETRIVMLRMFVVLKMAHDAAAQEMITLLIGPV